ncbi:redoxin domain-containing protein [Bacillus salipaludis]|uniref:redoxin domain-containing protein n=1 Tax=Bacillus salipaludis TaxID=2547811 RepID=UPI003D1F4145
MAERLSEQNWITGSENLVPVIVSTGTIENNKAWFQEHSINLQVVVQKEWEVGKVFKANGTPTGYLLDEQGRIASQLAVGAEEVFSLANSIPISDISKTKNEIVPLHETIQNIARPLSDSKLIRNGLPPGTTAPDFCLPLVFGGEQCLKQYRGQKILLVFSDPQCGPCNQLLPKLELFHRLVPSAQILVISRGDEVANRRKVLDSGLTMPVVLQRQWEISRLYGMFATPIGYMINEQGIIHSEVGIGIDAVLALLTYFR